MKKKTGAGTCNIMTLGSFVIIWNLGYNFFVSIHQLRIISQLNIVVVAWTNTLMRKLNMVPLAPFNNAFTTLLNLLQHLGLPVNYKKVEDPASEITCLGF